MSTVASLAAEFGVSEAEVTKAFGNGGDILDVRSALAEKKIEEAAAKEPVLTGAATKTISVVGRTTLIPLYVNYSNKLDANGEKIEILNGRVPSGIGLDDYRCVVTHRDMFSNGMPHEKDPEWAVSFQRSVQGEVYDANSPRQPLNRCGGLWPRDVKHNGQVIRTPVGNLSNPKPRDGRPVEFSLPAELNNARMILRPATGTEPGKFVLEITPQTLTKSRMERSFGTPKPPTPEQIAEYKPGHDSEIPF